MSLSLDEILKIKSTTSSTYGQQMKEMSDYAMQQMWEHTMETRPCYIYDYYHDDEKDKYKLSGYDPSKHVGKVKVDLRFIVSKHKAMGKDEPDYLIQFAPDDWNNDNEDSPLVDYFYKNYKPLGIENYVGFYLDIPDDKGVYHKWVICYSEDNVQFPKLGVIKCNYVFQWVIDKKNVRYKRKICGVERIAKSYTSRNANKPMCLHEVARYIWKLCSVSL